MANSGFKTISIKKETERFNSFISIDGNDRMIFSGIFGCGKTYFLREFFKDNQEYIVLHLYPVNYSVASNQDIFEYIKYDILYEILLNKPYLEKIDLPTIESLGFVSPKDQYEIIKNFIKIIPQIGKTIVDVLEPLEKIIEIIESKKAIKTDDGKAIQDFAKNMQSFKGSLYENDFYSRLITELIQRLKKVDGDRKVILIVDDLDRIDPEHIFRILNVLAVHFKNEKVTEYENKFDIDKIILCCDINNVRSIFAARYGQNVDFSGYIDKFYSNEIFNFDNTDLVKGIINEVLESIQYSGLFTSKQYVVYFLESMVKSGTLSLRNLKRLYGSSYTYQYQLALIRRNIIRLDEVPFYELFNFLNFANGNNTELTLECLKKTHFPSTHDIAYFSANLILIKDYRAHHFMNNIGVQYKSNQYKLVRDGNYRIEIEGAFTDEVLGNISIPEFKGLVIEGFQAFIDLKGISTDAR